MDSNVVQEPKEDSGAVVVGSILLMILFGSCANMPYHPEPDTKQEVQPQKIEHFQQVSTNLMTSVRHAYQSLTR